LRAEFPEAEITACDLLRDGVDFCAANFAAIPVYSDKDPSRIGLPRNAFDLIWVGSLFTHFDAARWTVFLAFLRDLLRPDGVLVLSTHGGRARDILTENPRVYNLDNSRRKRLLKQLARTGFGYSDYPTQREYGISIALPVWVCSLISSIPELRLVGLGEKSWDHHHDIYACVRDKSWDHHHDIYACVRDKSMVGSRSSLPVPPAPLEAARVTRS
jgi:SAM-dependent methyltransferase